MPKPIMKRGSTIFKISIWVHLLVPNLASIGKIPKVAPVKVTIKHHQPTKMANFRFLM